MPELFFPEKKPSKISKIFFKNKATRYAQLLTRDYFGAKIEFYHPK